MAHEELETLKAELFTPELDVRASEGPDRPVKVRLVELRTKAEKIDQDSEHFTKIGLDPARFSSALRTYAKALESAHSLFSHTPEELSAAEAVMKEYDDPAMKKIRGEIYSRLNYLCEFEGHHDLRLPLKRISEGDDIKDTILDLNGCFELAQHKSEDLARFAYGAEKIALLGEIYEKVSQAYPKVKAGDSMEIRARELRNRVFWYAQSYERKLREIVFPMVFSGDSSWRQRYASEYNR